MLTVTHNAGFFSCCTVRLEKIIEYFNTLKCAPEIVDSSQQFFWYKMMPMDITPVYFASNQTEIEIKSSDDKNIVKITDEKGEQQFTNYKKINYDTVLPFIDKYFKPSNNILNIVNMMEQKYNLKDNYQNICVLFYRGNDKSNETNSPSYDDFINKAKELKEKNPTIKFLLQSDETEFLESLTNAFPDDSFYFKEEIRHMKKNTTSSVDLDGLNERKNNFIFSQLFLTIIIIMSKCGYIICTTGNCSMWIAFYRRSANNMIQYLNHKEVIYGVKNECYDPNQTNYWIE